MGGGTPAPDPRYCGICRKEISDDEWVVNWGSCDDCFNEAYDEYLKDRDQPLEPIDIDLENTDEHDS